MKKAFMLSIIALSCSCSLKITPLKGNYPVTPIVYYSDSPVEKIWSNLIDFFAQKGISIKLIDHSSGLIVSEKTKLHASYENSKGFLFDPTAWAVVPEVKGPFDDNQRQKKIFYEDIIGEWNVRIKEDNGKTLININLLNFDENYTGGITTQDASNLKHLVESNAKTTGVFEKMIFDAIK